MRIIGEAILIQSMTATVIWVAKYEYDAWGNVLTVTDANNKSITEKNHIANLNYILLEFKF